MNRFERIYEWGVWGHKGGGSGAGSDPEFTRHLAGILTSICATYRVESVADLPCGAGVWQSALWIPHLNRMGVTYEGIDVAETAIKRFQETIDTQKLSANVRLGDLTKPFKLKADLILCRDALQHLPLPECVDVLENIAVNQPKMVLIGSYINGFNQSIPIGSYFPIDLRQEPFNLTPDWIVPELHDDSQIRKYLYLFKRNTLAKVDWKDMRDRAVAFAPSRHIN